MGQGKERQLFWKKSQVNKMLLIKVQADQLQQ